MAIQKKLQAFRKSGIYILAPASQLTLYICVFVQLSDISFLYYIQIKNSILIGDGCWFNCFCSYWNAKNGFYASRTLKKKPVVYHFYGIMCVDLLINCLNGSMENWMCVFFKRNRKKYWLSIDRFADIVIFSTNFGIALYLSYMSYKIDTINVIYTLPFVSKDLYVQ